MTVKPGLAQDAL